MNNNHAVTVATTVKLLMDKGIINKEQSEEIISRYPDVIKRLKQNQDKEFINRYNQSINFISPAEVIASFDYKTVEKHPKRLTEDFVTKIIAEDRGIPYKKIDPLKLDVDVVTSHIPKPFAIRNLIVPIHEKNGVVTIAVSDPSNFDSVESLKRARKIDIKLVLSSKTDIFKLIREFYGYQASVKAAEAEITPSVEMGNLEQYIKLKGQNEVEATDTHIVTAVEHLLQYAFDQRASDIHIEPKRENSIVRLRIDGVLHDIHTMPSAVHSPVLARLKMLSRMNIAEKRRPQDGRIKTNYNGTDIELRVSTMPVAFGEKIVIRIFDPQVLLQDIGQLGFYPREYKIFNDFIRRPNGVLLVTGPTGSGKTTTLYSSMKKLSSPEVNIVTIEDPIEMVVEDFNQVGVQPAIDVTFSTILKTILRQDPDIIMVGEIRDKETAENAVQSALTGHLVLSTLHTNDAPSSITRLLDMHIPAYLISSTLIGVVAQRLVRKICPACKESRKLSGGEMKHLQLEVTDAVVYLGKGCVDCRGTGYKGREGIFEILEFTEKVKSIVSDNPKIKDIQGVAKTEGMMTLRECAVKKMLEGVTTYEEVVAVTG